MSGVRITVPARGGEIALCAALAALALYAGVSGYRMPLGQPNLPGPGVFPLALASLLGIASIARIGWLVARPGDVSGTVDLGHLNIVVVVLALGGIAFALERLGFAITMFAFLCPLFRLLSGRAWWRAALLATISVAGFWLFFEKLIGVSLPRGDLPWI